MAEERFVSEQKLGMVERTSPIDFGWSGDMRKRYTDFLVYEVKKDGTVIHLTDYEEPKPKVSQKPKEAGPGVQKAGEQAPSGDEKPEGSETVVQQIPEEDRQILADLFGLTVAGELLDLDQAVQLNTHDKKSPPLKLGKFDRSERGRLHQEIRRIFSGRVESTTDSDGDITAIPFKPHMASNWRKPSQTRRFPANDGTRFGNGVKSFNELGGEYLHFTMYKENKDSMDAINMVARMLKLKSNSFGFAGTKDRRAATVQRISVRKKRANDLLFLNSKLQNVRLGDFKHSKYPIELGQHGGNEFVIIMKNVEHIRGTNCSVATRVKMVEEAVETGLRYFYENGFLNYFGLQRFGTHEVGTHELGMKIMLEDYRGVVDAICQVPAELEKALASGDIDGLTGYQQDDMNRARALTLWSTTGDAKAALQIMPRRFHGESRIIEHLSKQRNDYMGALLTINRGLRQMYGHAYQSFVWNHVASFRWAKYGSRVIVGDLILVDDDKPQQSKPLDGDEEMPDTNEEYENFYASARPLTAEDVASGRYTIFDVVLPQPGYDVVYPTNEVGQFYKTFMASEQGGKLDPYSMRRKHKEFSLSGGYRNLISRFQTVPEYLVRTYSHDEEQMYPTDLDLVLAKKAREQAEIKDLKRRRSFAGEHASASGLAAEPMAAAAAQNKRVKTDDAPGAAGGSGGDDRSAFLLARLEEMAASADDTTNDLTAALASPPIIGTPVAAGTPRAASPTPAGGPSSATAPTAPVVPVLRQVTGNTIRRFAPGAYTWEGAGGSGDLGDKVAVVLKFQLPASSYATVVLRELQTALAGERNPKCD